jgi:three-Cys-motif partner protein
VNRPYDLDRDVQRVLAREKELAKEHALLDHGPQLELFSGEVFEERPFWRYETQGLVVDDDLLFSRAISEHSLVKAHCARRYAEIVGTAMGGKWSLWWVELFAGPGQLYRRDTGEFAPGSPLEALSIPRPFNGYVFVDLERRCVGSLDRRAGGAKNVHILQGDANSVHTLDRIAAIVPRTRALVVLYADPAGVTLDWATVKFFIDRWRHLDLLLNLPTNGLVRAIAGGDGVGRASRFLSHPEPHRLIAVAPGMKDEAIRQQYRHNLEAHGFHQIDGVTVKLHGRNRDLYDLLIASRHPLAAKIFREAARQPRAA